MWIYPLFYFSFTSKWKKFLENKEKESLSKAILISHSNQVFPRISVKVIKPTFPGQNIPISQLNL